MEELKKAVMAICIVSAAVSLTGNLVSGTRLRSQMRLILDLVLAMTIITPFVRGASAFEIPDTGSIAQPDERFALELYNNELERQISENVAGVLGEQLTAAGINCENIRVEVNISEDGSIFISRVALRTDSFKAAADMVRSSLGSRTEIVRTEEIK